jgi:hypothetical protein
MTGSEKGKWTPEQCEQAYAALRRLYKSAVGLAWEPVGTVGDASDWFRCVMCGSQQRGPEFAHASNCPMAVARALLSSLSGEAGK